MYYRTHKRKSFFNDFFPKLAGTTLLRQQIEQGYTQEQIRASWEPGLVAYRKKRAQYLLYK
jgi:uncharacterized protein YbbC (DUF1343 family)